VSDFNPLMMVGFRYNHNIQFLGTSNEECLKRIYYLANYVTKNGISSYQAIDFATCAYVKTNIDKNVSPDDYAKQILYKTYNFAANLTEYSGAQIANMILNNGRDGTYYSSHETININVWEILKFLKILKTDNELVNDSDSEEFVQMPIDEDFINKEYIKIKDYIYRNESINSLNIYSYASKYIKKKFQKEKIQPILFFHFRKVILNI
jgi:hypothetical protein